MIRRTGPQTWTNVHVAEKAELDDLIDIDNSTAAGRIPSGFTLLNQAAGAFEELVKGARQTGRRVRGLGSGWALTDIAVTDGWLLNTKLLNGCFELSDRYFDDRYAVADRPFVVVAQCGISVGELNVYLEVTASPGFRRSLKTAGIGAGQTIVGAISGNTHGSAINYGSMSDFVVGMQVITGSGRTQWIERASHPVLNDQFTAKLGADLVRDDDVFNAAVVSFGAFGIISAVAIETDPVYHLKFPPVKDISHEDLKRKLNNFDSNDPERLHHYEFVFDPYSRNGPAMVALATREKFEPGGKIPDPVWIIRSDKGFAPGDRMSRPFFGLPLLTPAQKTRIQFDQYRDRCILSDVTGTSGQLFTATITYLEGYTESALGISLDDAAKMIEISTEVIKRMELPAMSQVRVVHPSTALLGSTTLPPKTAVFEFGLANDSNFAVFEKNLTDELTAAGVAYTLHWSKNSGITPDTLHTMYGTPRIEKWRAARRRVFGDDDALMKVFENDHLVRARLV